MKLFFSVSLFCFLLSSCSIHQNIMWRDTRKMESNRLPPAGEEYKIAVNDIISITIRPNKGISLIDPIGGSSGGEGNFNQASAQNSSLQQYQVDADGKIKLPVFGYTKIIGKTVVQAERFLEEKFERIYKDPFVRIQVQSRKVILFTGKGGNARVIKLNELNTTLMEAIATAGGIDAMGKAKGVKIIRKENDVYRVYRIDLRTVDNLKATELVLQSNDIVYIEPVRNYAGEAVRNMAPYFSLLSSALLIYTLATGGF